MATRSEPPFIAIPAAGGRENLLTVRTGDHYRVLGLLETGAVQWIWIGAHAEYNRLIRD